MTNYKNLSKAALIEHAIAKKEGFFSSSGSFMVNTGKYTGRSPKDKFTVKDPQTEKVIWFHDGNKPMSPEHADALHKKIKDYLAARDHYVQECLVGESDGHSLKIRFNTERAWHALFVRNMFIDSVAKDSSRECDFELFHAPGFLANSALDHTQSEVAIILDLTKRRVVICGSEYAGEIKKSIFTVMNFLLPNKGALGMHCSANKSKNGDVAIFFGLSGTGKTTLSAERERSLIGDDEHGWDDEGIFNFEGGCYAKVIKLSQKDEPEIYQASQHFTTILENVVYDQESRLVDFNDARYTENTRSSYDLSFIPNACLSRKGGHPKHIIMLTCDAFGVLPPLSRLSPAQASFHFLNGYTAKVAGTERGIKEPQAVFSPCFGGPFMAHFPEVYAKILAEKIKKHEVQCWLVNTGWTGGPYGVGSRMPIPMTRRLLHAALDGELNKTKFSPDPFFGLLLPSEVQGVDKNLLSPSTSWADKDAYKEAAQKLLKLFHENFEPYKKLVSEEIRAALPTL
jgi:phosphoenolpyruvate carboxykinase (ATP)